MDSGDTGAPGGTNINYDQVLEYIGQFGTYQKRIFFLLWLASAAAGLAVMVFTFTGYVPLYRCRVPQCENLNASYYSSDEKLPSFYKITKLEEADRCKRPTIGHGDDLCSNNSILLDEHEKCNFTELIFDRSVMANTVVDEFEFYCDSSWKRTIYNALYMVGMLFGSYLFGWISDLYGRNISLMLSVLTVSLGGFIGAFCTSPVGVHGYGILRVITGMGGIGCFMVCFVLAVEHVGYKWTMLIGIAIEIPFAIGEWVLGLEAYFIRDWQILQIVAYIPLIVLIGLYWLVPESPRWLIGVGRIEEAETIVRKAAKVNGQEFPHHLFKSVDTAQSESKSLKVRTTVLDLFRPQKMALRTLNMCFQWFSVTLCYYGLSNASTSLGSDPFVSFMLSVFIEIPGYIFCLFVMDCWGRRPILSFCQGVSGVACIICSLLMMSDDPGVTTLRMILSLLGKFGAAASFAIVYVYTAEMFPTTIRNQAVGTCSLVARFGGITALLLDNLSKYWISGPIFIMGVIATVAGVLAVLFPETLGHTLPETMEEALNIKSDRSFCTFTCVSFSDMFKEELKVVPNKNKVVPTKKGVDNIAMEKD